MIFSRRFQNPVTAPAHGLVGIGVPLTPSILLEAYSRGIFPFFDASNPRLWWSPDPRGIIELDGIHVSRSLARTLRSGKFTTTINRDFAGVIAGCADRPPDPGNWLLPDMIEAYTELHSLGHAHSLEVWQDGDLVGGIYGLAIGAVFCGESMFSRQTDASKVALVHLVNHLRQQGFHLLDVQYVNPHTRRLGAVSIPRKEYLARLRRAVNAPVRFVASPSS